MTLLRLSFATFFLLIGISLTAQNIAPTLNCVRRDSLFWDVLPATTACGTFQAYRIYAANNQNGPYTLLANITNINQSRYFHATAAGRTWYYYMESEYGCAMTLPKRQSDTLDNQPPTQTPITVVSVLNNRSVEIRWRKNTSPEVAGYVIYKETNIGLIPIDTVNSADTLRYVDNNATPSQKPEKYQILAIDRCGNASLFDKAHATIRLTTTQNLCQQSLTLNWTAYTGWDKNEIQEYQVWIGVNGLPAFLCCSFTADTLTYRVEQVNKNDRYNIYIVARNRLTNLLSNSNITMDTLRNLNQANNELLLQGATVNDDNSVDLTWIQNTNADIVRYELKRVVSSDTTLQQLFTFAPSFPLDRQILYKDATAEGQKTSYNYILKTVDKCNNVKDGGEFSTIFLQLSNESGINISTLTWNPLFGSKARVQSYQVLRIEDNNITNVGEPIAPKDSIMTYQDTFRSTSNGAQTCYAIAARYTYNNPDGKPQEGTARSNKACIFKEVKIIAPNAFAPNGNNPEFRPILQNGVNAITYRMRIFDRWGSQVFESNDLNVGWNGKSGGVDMPQGGYVYLIQVTEPNNGVDETRGVVLLLR